MDKVLREERGWAGHFILAHQCLFRRNTLLTYNKVKVVVSTVGRLIINKEMVEIGSDERYYETMAFHSKSDDRYFDADVSRQIEFDSEWAVYIKDGELEANKMHEIVVEEIINKLLSGELNED